MKKRALAMLLCFLMVFQSFGVFAEAVDREKVELKVNQVTDNYMEISVTPKEVVGRIQGVTTDSLTQLVLAGSKNSIGWTHEQSYAVEEHAGKLYIPILKNKHTLSLNLGDKTLHYILDGREFEPIDAAHAPKGKLHIKLDGYFEGALVGQRKYDAISGGTGQVSDNKNSNIKVYGQITDEGEAPAPGAWKELSKSGIEVDKGKTKLLLSKESGMVAKFNAMDSSITLQGTPAKVGDYPVKIELVDIYGRTATSNEAWFAVSDIESTYLDKVMTDVNTKLKTTDNGKVLFNQEPWYIAYFNEHNRGKGQRYVVPKNINLWQGSRESGTYGQLGLILGVNENPNREKFEYLRHEDRVPIQEFIVPKGANLTLVNMKVFSGVNIVVEDGAILNVHDSSIYGKITVNKGGRLRVNHDPEGHMTDGFEESNGNKVISGTSIQGQIILNDGATIEDSYIYSNTNNLSDTGAVANTRPVVLVKGDAFIKGNVFVKGDESPTGTDIDTGRPYRGQEALRVDGGSLTILDNASLNLYGGGTYTTTSLGGHALTLENGGKVLGNGNLVAIGGLGGSGEGGYAAAGDGVISTKKAYLRGGNGAKTAPTDGKVQITKQVEGQMRTGQPGSTNSWEYWSHSSVPKRLTAEAIGHTPINPNGQEPIEGKASPEYNDPDPGKKMKRVELETNQYHVKSIAINPKDVDSVAWLDALAAGEGSVMLREEKLGKSGGETLKGYRISGNALYIDGLKLGDIVEIKVDGYIPVKLEAVESGQTYRLEPYQHNEEKPYLPEEEQTIDDEHVKQAREYILGLVLNDGILKLDGIDTARNQNNILALKESVKAAKELAKKSNLTDSEKEKLVRAYTTKFGDKTKNILVDMQLQSPKTVANRHDNSRLHAVLKDGNVEYTSKLKGLTKDGNPKVKVYRIDKSEYEADAMTSGTPKFENRLLDPKYFSIEESDNKATAGLLKAENIGGRYTLMFNEGAIKRDFPNTELLKIVFSAEIGGGLLVENSDFVFLSKDAQSIPETPNKPDHNGKEIIGEDDPATKPDKPSQPGKKDDSKPKGHWEYRVTKKLRPIRIVKKSDVAEEPFIVGYPDGTFKPEGSVTRAESAKMMLKLEKGRASKAKADFKDVKDDWYNEAINYTAAKHMLLAKDGKIRPNDAITRGEFARMLMPILPNKRGKDLFRDVEGHEFEDAILRAYANGVVLGYPDRTFKPDGKITRAEAVAMLNRVYKKYVTQKELDKNKSVMKRFVDVTKAHWAYLDIMSAINYPELHKTTKEEVSYEWRHAKVKEKVWIEDKTQDVEEKPEVKKEFEKRTIEDKARQASLEGRLEKNATLEVKDRTKIEGGKIEIVVPKTILEDLKKLKAPAGKIYEVVKSYDVNLIGEHEGALKVNLAVGNEHEGKNARIKHLSSKGLKTYKAAVKDGRVSCTVDGLSPFVIILEEDAPQEPKQDKELDAAIAALAAAIDESEKIETKKFTKTSVEAFNVALQRAQNTLTSEDKGEVETATENLKKAKNALVPLGNVDFLKETIKKAEAKLQEKTWTERSAEPLRELLASYETFDPSDATREHIEEMIKKIELATVELEERGDVDALKAKLADAGTKSEDKTWTEASRNALKNFLKAYDAFDFGNATTEIVEKEMKNIDSAIAKLQKAEQKKIEVKVKLYNGRRWAELTGITGETFGELRDVFGTYTINDPREDYKVFRGWKINGQNPAIPTEEFKKTVMTEEMLDKNGEIVILPDFGTENNAGNNPGNTDGKLKFLTKEVERAIAIDTTDSYTLDWAKKIKAGEATVTKYPSGTPVPKANMAYNSGYYVYGGTYSVRVHDNQLKQGGIVKISLADYEDVYLQAAKDSRGDYKLVRIEDPTK